ncbi:MAG TPA: hypothetical protein DDX20_07540 [Stenotrophomonas sp.]|nr:hypothetical protein [Stenotrophomonas sp.]
MQSLSPRSSAPLDVLSYPDAIPRPGSGNRLHGLIDDIGNPYVPAMDAAARTLQAGWRGARVRRDFRVRSVGPAAVHVQIRADAVALARTRLAAALAQGQILAQRDRACDVHITWLALDARRYHGRVVADGSLLDPVENCRCPAAHTPPSRHPVAIINGGFFNHRQRASASAPEAAAVGSIHSPERTDLPCLPPPSPFEDDYHTMRFSDGSQLASAPLLSDQGRPVFSLRMGQDPRYRLPDGFSFERGDCIVPGSLWHAGDPNPRAGISLPGTANDGSYRLLVALMSARERPASGFTLAAFSRLMAAVDTLQTPPGTSVNLDGGESVSLQAAVDGRGCVNARQSVQARRVGNLLAFCSCPSQNAGPEAAATG